MRVKYLNKQIKTITNLLVVNVEHKQEVIDYFVGRMEIKGYEYEPLTPIELIILYHFKTDIGSRNEYESYFGEELDSVNNIEIIPSPSLEYSKVGNYELPITTEIYK